MREFNKNFIRYSDKKVKEEKNNLAFYLSTRIIFYIVLIFFAIFFIWYTAFVTTHSFYAVSGVSMMGTLNNQISSSEMERGKNFQDVSYDAVYIDKTTKAKVFDIVVIETKEIDTKTGKNKNIIKRVMAQAGDYITIAKAVGQDGQEHFYFFRIPAESLIDGSVPEDFTDEMARVDESGKNGYSIYSYENWDTNNTTSLKPAEGGSHVYEDGRKSVNYSSEGFYSKFLSDYFSGKNLGRYYVSKNGLVYVKVPQGKFFYMGDNRAHSSDARENGFGDVSAILGRTEFVVYDFNFGNRLLEVAKFYFREVEKFFAR